jgi:hypothetical protein
MRIRHGVSNDRSQFLPGSQHAVLRLQQRRRPESRDVSWPYEDVIRATGILVLLDAQDISWSMQLESYRSAISTE